MRGVVIKILAIVASVIAGLLVALKFAADWIGRSTIADDAVALWGKASIAMLWLIEQPALIFYWVPAALIIVALLLAFQPEIAVALSQRVNMAARQMGYQLNYHIWDNIPEIRMHQAAALWAEIVPSTYSKDLNAGARPHLEMLIKAADRGDLKVERFISGGHGGLEKRGNDIVTREALRDYAEKVAQKPKFLFPETRRNSWMI